MYDYLVVGAGISGCTVAERLANAGASVLVVDSTHDLGGNAHDGYNNRGILVHFYGPHIFHTNSEKVYSYLSNFTEWHPYVHKVLVSTHGVLYPFPINRTTINMYRNQYLPSPQDLTEEQVKDWLDKERMPRYPRRTSEDVVINAIGPSLYDLFYRGYTLKQWGVDPSQLDASVCGRIPVRTNDDDRYFTDKYQGIPKPGYSHMFRNMLSGKNITFRCLTYDPVTAGEELHAGHVIYTGPIDTYFGHCFGELPYRTVRFVFVHLKKDYWTEEKVAVINYPGLEHSYTRITDFKRMTGQECKGTTILVEYPNSHNGRVCYPIPTPANAALYKRYVDLSLKEKHVTFLGRLGRYQYLNMDQACAAAISCAYGLLGINLMVESNCTKVKYRGTRK